MVESKLRKAAFLRDAIRQIPLHAADVFNNRLEELTARPELHESFDVVSMRAVRVDADLLTALKPLLSPGGLVLWFRSPNEPLGETSYFAVQAVLPLAKGAELTVLRRPE